MRQMSGPELANRLIAIQPEIKVLFMSGYTDNAVALRGAIDTQTFFLGKPFTAAILTAKVREALGKADK
jgi:two-component system cell cycle sensor histidine kinase/response regulator CckA